MIERKNIIKLLGERTKTNAYHSAILTCYNFDPIFFETVCLPVLRSQGITNVIVIMDAGMYDKMLADTSYACHCVSPVNYTLVRQENTHHGVFHSKTFLLFGEEGALVVGSGNLTFSGLSNNEEVWNAFHVAGNESVHYPLLLKTWNYINDALLNSPPLVEKQLGWIKEQSLWLQNGDYANWVTLESGEECSIIYNSPTSGIIDDVAKAIGDANIEQITVIAPFYDTEGNALKELTNRFKPYRMNCILDLQRQCAPFALLDTSTDIVFYKHTSSNPLHAKIIEFRSDNETWILSGSANAGNMALGLNKTVYNDEACVLIHSFERKNYVKELGIKYEPLNDDERKSIERPQQKKTEPLTLMTKLKACEEKEGKVYLYFSKSGIKGNAAILDKDLKVIYKEDIVANNKVELLMDESLLAKSHMAVLKDNDTNISNCCLIIKELHVESCNPDPKRRRLSNLLDDDDLLQNLTHILGYIEFDENDKKQKSVNLTTKASSSKDKEDIVVTQECFNDLKDSQLGISMHSGVRILAYLQQILFNKEDAKRSDDDLLEIDKKENVNNKKDSADDTQATETSSVADDAQKIKSNIVYFLKNMQKFLLDKTKDTSIHVEDKIINSPRLMAVPGLNVSSAFAVASRAVLILMNKYGSYIIKRRDVREMLIKCAGLFFSLYANAVPDDNSNRSVKIRTLLKEASVDLLSALAFFEFRKDDMTLPVVILNCLDLWCGKEELQSVIPLYEEQLTKLNTENLCQKTVDRIKSVANVYLEGNTPVREFSRYDDVVYLYKKGYGFMLVDNIKMDSDGLTYECHSSWFDNKSAKSSATKFKGYKNL